MIFYISGASILAYTFFLGFFAFFFASFIFSTAFLLPSCTMRAYSFACYAFDCF
jgi:hypothetical protein